MATTTARTIRIAPAAPRALEPVGDPEVDDAVAAERAVIGGILMAGGTGQREILALVRNDDFCDPSCAWLIGPLRDMVMSGHPVDQILFPAWLIEHGLTPKESSRRNLRVMLADICSDTPILDNALWYARVVVGQSARRKARAAMRRMGAEADAAMGTDLDTIRELLRNELRAAFRAINRAERLMK